MTPFEYVSVLISIILGLGITQILIGVSELIRRWARLTFHLPYVLWIVLVFIMHVHEWWIIYEFKHFEAWHLHFFLLIALYPINLFILANLLFPQNWPRKRFNMLKYYSRQWVSMYSVGLALPVITILQNSLIHEISVREQSAPIILALCFLLMLIFRPRHQWVHMVFALLLVAGLIIDLVLERNMLQIAQ